MATVPIVTEVTKAQLDALVAANGLNEGLQYRVTDKGWLLIATGVSTYKFVSIPYKAYCALLTNENVTDNVIPVILQNEIGEIVWSKQAGDGDYFGTLIDAFPMGKTAIIIGNQFRNDYNWIYMLSSWINTSNVQLQTVNDQFINVNGCLDNTYIEIRVYEF